MSDLDDVIQKILEKKEKFGIVLNPPVSATAIEEFEKVFEFAIPNDILQFYRYCNRFQANGDYLDILSLEDIVYEQNRYQTGIMGQQFVFAHYLVFSDCWDIRLTPNQASIYEIINSNHGAEKTVVLTDSLADFIIRYLDSSGVFGEDGLYEWYEHRKNLGY